MNSLSKRVGRFYLVVAILLAVCGFWQTLTIASATDLKISPNPLFVGQKIPPNVFIELDDSGSMDFDILTVSHWDRAAYDSTALEKTCDSTVLPSGCADWVNCSNKDANCGGWRIDGAITIGGGKNLDGYAVPISTFRYVGSCRITTDAEYNNGEGKTKNGCVAANDNAYNDYCGPALNKSNNQKASSSNKSLANCPETEAKDWRVRSSALNTMFYNPLITYKPWSGQLDAVFSSARSYPIDAVKSPSGVEGFDLITNLGKDAVLGHDPETGAEGFVYYVWDDDKGYAGDNILPPKTGYGRPRRGANVNSTKTPNGIVDLWDSHYKVTVTETSLSVQKITCNPSATGLNCTAAAATLPQAKGGGRVLAEEKKNIANWYQYYRRRMMTAKYSLADILNIDKEYRFGLSVINSWDKLFVPVPVANANGIYDFKTQNSLIKDNLYKFPPQALGTPLRAALARTGEYYKGKIAGKGTPITHSCQQNFTLLLTDGYWNESYSSGTAGVTLPTIADVDSDGHGSGTGGPTLADVARYYFLNDLSPLYDGVYPEKGLYPANTAKPDQTWWNPNKHQHMITLGIAFGARGTLVDTDLDGWPDPPLTKPQETGKEGDLAWPDPFGKAAGEVNAQCSGGNQECGAKIDDLWHAAYNSRGFFGTAASPDALLDKLYAALALIEDRQTSAAATAVSSTIYVDEGTYTFQARFTSGKWNGELLMYQVAKDGTLTPVAGWNAGDIINQQPWDANTKDKDGMLGRQILTYNPTTKSSKAFLWANLSDWQKQLLNTDPVTGLVELGETAKGEKRVAYLRGRGAAMDYEKSSEFNNPDTTQWMQDNNFRIRLSKLGDTVYSDPVYISEPRFQYPEASYSTFRDERRQNRPPMIYVGANDGMLHGFSALPDLTQGGGKEKIAYVPYAVYKRLPLLTDPSYKHRFYVDGQATAGDVFFNNAWHTVLVGSLRAGGQGYFALDVTYPENFKEADPSIVLWEFTDDSGIVKSADESSKDLGYSFAKPAIARMTNGKWVAIFGNGYNNTEPDDYKKPDGSQVSSTSSTGNAVLFIVDMQTGGLIRALNTKAGSAADPLKLNRPNGLSSPAAVDINGDYQVDFIYAGDLFGNLWKFDVSSSSAAEWKIGNGNQPLFKAISPEGTAQPITTLPVVDTHPTGEGTMVYFGTGKYFEEDDNQAENQPTQTFYGIWDQNTKEPTTPFLRANLQQQDILSQDVKVAGSSTRITTDNNVEWYDAAGKPNKRGWYLDLRVKGQANKGEKQVTNPILRNKQIIFTTLVPSTNPCDFGGSSWLMVLDATNGGQLNTSPFDFDLNGQFNEQDLALYDGKLQPVSGRQPNPEQIGMVGRPSFISTGDVLLPNLCGTSGECDQIPQNPMERPFSRESWRPL